MGPGLEEVLHDGFMDGKDGTLVGCVIIVGINKTFRRRQGAVEGEDLMGNLLRQILLVRVIVIFE
jgi:hypothetical protein